MQLLYKAQILEQNYVSRSEAGNGNQRLIDAEWESVMKFVADVERYGKEVLGFQETGASAELLRLSIARKFAVYDSSSIGTEIKHLNASLIRAVFKHKFIQVPNQVKQYVQQDHPFGQTVSKHFPSAVSDLIAAGNCLGVGCYPASAFHLMRAAEVGLWELGRDRKIPLAVSGKIEFTEWGKIIGELEESVKLIQQWPNSALKEEAHKFYNSAVVEIRAFNDGWRRHSAHARPYMPTMEIDEAVALWGHVFRFLNVLASKISEGGYTPLVWK